MAKAYYTDYVRHCLRFYSRYPQLSEFENEIDELNWKAVERVVSRLEVGQREMIIAIYTGRDTFADEIYNAAQLFGVEQNELWVLTRKVEQQIANERSL